MAKPHLTKKLAAIWENAVDEGYKELTGKIFSPEDRETFKELGVKYAEAVVSGKSHKIASYENALGFYLAVEAREVEDELTSRIKQGIADSLPIILKIVAGALGCAL